MELCLFFLLLHKLLILITLIIYETYLLLFIMISIYYIFIENK
uniref:Uncharacterized protein n=1 Tax=viral metagenome TaxID=1070528 RepID=A0A6C0H8K4_9ZZZZ